MSSLFNVPLSLPGSRSGVDGATGAVLSTVMELVVAVPELTAVELFSSVPLAEPVNVNVPLPPVTEQL